MSATEIGTGVVVAVVATMVVGMLVWLRREVLRAWHRRRPADVGVRPLPHVPPGVTIPAALPHVAAAFEHVVSEPWAVALEGALPDAGAFEASKPSPAEAHDWLRSHGAVDFRETKLRLSLASRTDELIVVRDIRVGVEHSEPWAGTYVYCPTAGVNTATLLMFELDEPAPRAWQWDEDGSRRRVGSVPFFEHQNVTIASGEVHDFVIIGRAESSLARWRLVVELEVGGHKKTLLVDDDGDWFTTSGAPKSGFAIRLHWAWYAGGRFLPEPDDKL